MMRVRGIVLAAGAARRLGEPKALVELAGRSFLVRVIDALSAGGVSEIVVVVGEPHADAVRSAVAAHPGVVTVDNPDPSRGQLSSLQAALTQVDLASLDAVLVHPVDIPGLTGDDVAALVAGAAAHPACALAVPSVAGRRAHPLLIRAALIEDVRQLGPAATLRDLYGRSDIGIHHVESDNALLRHDVDTPEDLAELRQRLEP